MAALRRRLSLSDDLIAILGWTLLTIVAVGLIPSHSGSVIRLLVAGSYLLFVPGYAFVALLFPRAGQLSLLERGTFSVGASLALVGLLGIPLDVTPWGVQVWTILLEQFVVVSVLVGLTEARRRRVEDADRATPLEDFRSLLERGWEQRNLVGGGNRVLQIAIVIAILASVGATAYTVATPLPSEQYTELYVLGPDGTIDGLPQNATAGEPVELTLGIANHEYEEVTYGLQVQLRTANAVSVIETESHRLAHNRSWNSVQTYEIPRNASRVKLEFLLFRETPSGTPTDSDQAYRSVHVWLNVTS